MNAIDVNGLSKVYRLGQHLDPRRTFREFISNDLNWLPRWSRGKGSPADSEHSHPKEKWALTDVSFSTRQGEVLGLIGPNGAGKSTLLKIMSRITDPSLGQVRLRGRVGSLLEVGSGFHPELTGRENIYLYGAILGMTRAEIAAQFSDIVDYAGVSESIDTPVKRYSSGMYVRLAFAVAAFLRTDILFIDEVLAVGDLSFQRRCLGTVKSIAESGRTVVFVSHNMSVIQSLCQRVLLIENGRLTFDGDTSAGVRQYIQSQETELLHRSSISALSDDGDDFRFMALTLKSSHGEQVTTVSTGDVLSIVFSYIKRDRCPGLEIVMSIYDELGIAVCNFSTRLTKKRFSGDGVDAEQLTTGSAGVQALTCTIDRVPLLPGRYRINILARNGPDCLQYIADAMKFDVISGDYFGTGKLPEIGAVAVDHHWHDRADRSELL